MSSLVNTRPRSMCICRRLCSVCPCLEMPVYAVLRTMSMRSGLCKASLHQFMLLSQKTAMYVLARNTIFCATKVTACAKGCVVHVLACNHQFVPNWGQCPCPCLFMHFWGQWVCTVACVRYVYTRKHQLILCHDRCTCVSLLGIEVRAHA